jgi:hypothetical protein
MDTQPMEILLVEDNEDDIVAERGSRRSQAH